MNLTIDSQSNGICHMSVNGRISQTTSDQTNDPLVQLLGEANYNQSILLSLENTEFIDSSGIGWLLSVNQRIRAAGGQLVLHSAPADVQQVFGLMKLDKVLRIVESADAASHALEETSSDG